MILRDNAFIVITWSILTLLRFLFGIGHFLAMEEDDMVKSHFQEKLTLRKSWVMETFSVWSYLSFTQIF